MIKNIAKITTGLLVLTTLTTGCAGGLLLSEKYQAPVIVKPGNDALYATYEAKCRLIGNQSEPNATAREAINRANDKSAAIADAAITGVVAGGVVAAIEGQDTAVGSGLGALFGLFGALAQENAKERAIRVAHARNIYTTCLKEYAKKNDNAWELIEVEGE